MEVSQPSFPSSCMFWSWVLVTPGLEAGDLSTLFTAWKSLAGGPGFVWGATRSSWGRTDAKDRDAGIQIQPENDIPVAEAEVVWEQGGLLPVLPAEPWRRRHSETLRAAPEDSGCLGQVSPAPGHASVPVGKTRKEHLLLLAEQLRHHSETRGSGESVKGWQLGRRGAAWVSSVAPTASGAKADSGVMGNRGQCTEIEDNNRMGKTRDLFRRRQ